MNLASISRVVELNSENDVNDYLSAGWRLINVYNTMSAPNHQSVNYVLGWDVWQGNEPKFPEKSYDLQKLLGNSDKD